MSVCDLGYVPVCLSVCPFVCLVCVQMSVYLSVCLVFRGVVSVHLCVCTGHAGGQVVNLECYY